MLMMGLVFRVLLIHYSVIEIIAVQGHILILCGMNHRRTHILVDLLLNLHLRGLLVPFQIVLVQL